MAFFSGDSARFLSCTDFPRVFVVKETSDDENEQNYRLDALQSVQKPAWYRKVIHCHMRFSIRVHLQRKRSGSPLEVKITTTTMTKVGLLAGGLLM